MSVLPGALALSIIKFLEIPRVDVDINVVIVHVEISESPLGALLDCTVNFE
tara:strand:- start:810 stop:962 length:153 start_codon:yes stop_codon:yes gene_type:complete